MNTPQYKDTRGTLLVEGQRVAYNISGSVAIGRITELRAKQGYSSAAVKVIMEQDRCAGHRRGHITKLRYPESLVVLKDGEF